MDRNSIAYGKSKTSSNSISQAEQQKQEDAQSRKADSSSHNDNIETPEEEFDFRLWGGPFWKNSEEMCTADEVFFQGQILPLLQRRNKDQRRLKRCESRSDNSTEHEYSYSHSRSNSSRSSSVRSQNSSNITTPKVSKPTSQNRFHTHPSPKPQLIRVPIPRQASVGRKSSTWDFFRLGVVPAPEIELQDLKVRRTTSNSNSSSNSGTTKSSTITHYRDKSNHGLLFLSSCKCSIETEPLNTVVINSGTKSTNETESETHAVKEKVVLEMKKQKQREKQGKKDMSRRRTFEWLKELSHASYPQEEALILNS
ncbi:putative vacuolar protein sorting-associated protein 13B [Senna tora]|uniref:Putative vacuolar protein sorting-associated protein 13B n=1 Tax=Senna tora TaxID=362788 RepID=A0A834WR31_9FABA|nr:putative vacuolar protein sorting-associated protein 13B [Senna tora]